jgi:hypothetical protein
MTNTSFQGLADHRGHNPAPRPTWVPTPGLPFVASGV